MKKWTNFYDIKTKLDKKWKNGEILRNIVEDNSLFPYEIKIQGPDSKELSLEFEKVIKWIEELKCNSKDIINYGYSIKEKEINFRIVGKNSIPVYATIETLEDALKLIKKNTEAKKYEKIYNEFTKEWKNHPNFSFLKEWLLKYPFRAIKGIGEDYFKFIIIIKWFEKNPNHYMYIRQLDINGVDTKFIENHESILGELLEILLPKNNYDLEQKKFEDKFKLKRKPDMVRFRILDENYSQNLFSDLSIPIDEFKLWNNNIKNVFFTENEINFLCFPSCKNSIVIFGKGYGISLLKDVKWLIDKEIYYWGDIDTHGFNILSIARGFLPHIKSFLMSEKILLEHKALWVKEDTPFLSDIKNLTLEEQELLVKLQTNSLGANVRLEQERINFKYVKNYIDEISN